MRSVPLIVLLEVWLDPLKGLSTHIACNERNAFSLRHLLSLEEEEKIPLNEPIVKLVTFSVVEVRLTNIYHVTSPSVDVRVVQVVQARATRGSTAS